DDTRGDDVTLEPGTVFDELVALLLRAEPHHTLHPRPVIPAAVEDDDLAAGREMLNVALGVELGFFAVGGGRQRHQTEDARTHALRDRLDRSALAGRVAPLEHDDDARLLVDHPVLEPAQFGVELLQLLLVLLALHPRFGFFGLLLRHGTLPGVHDFGAVAGLTLLSDRVSHLRPTERTTRLPAQRRAGGPGRRGGCSRKTRAVGTRPLRRWP